MYLAGGLANDANLPMLICGQHATLTFGGAGFAIEPQGAAGNKKPRSEVARKRPGSLEEHRKDFLKCIEMRQKPRSHEVHGYHVMAALHMGVRSYLEGKVLDFQPEKQEALPA